MTKTFRTWLSERNPELLKEIDKREKIRLKDEEIYHINRIFRGF